MRASSVSEPNMPTNSNWLFWPPEQQSPGYRNVEAVFNTQICACGPISRALPQGRPIDIAWSKTDGSRMSLDDYWHLNHVSGLLVLQRGQIRLERYGRGFSADQRWTSFSVAKSFTSTLVGAAIQDGLISGLEARITDTIPELLGSAYDDVTVRQVLTMTSGVRWNEDYTDPKSDVAQAGRDLGIVGVHPTLEYMRRLPRAAPPGTRNNYNTGETDLAGILVSRATGLSLSDYLSQKIWVPFGMERDAIWICDRQGRERGGSGLSASLRDFARFGLFMLEGGVAAGERVVPQDWIATATTNQIPQPLDGGGGYGFQWWTSPDGSYRGAGIFGQGLFIDPALDLAVATTGTWPKAVDIELANNREAFIQGVRRAAAA